MLYFVARPPRNLLLDEYLAKVMRGELTVREILLDCAPALLRQRCWL